MRNVVATYQSLSSYQDRGVMTSTVTQGAESWVTRQEFETLFARPSKLRFAWTEETNLRPGKTHSAVWSDGTSSWSSYSMNDNKPELERDLGLAVAGATGITHFASHQIPRLLTDEIGGVRLDGLEDYEVVGQESVDGAACVMVSARYPDTFRVIMWIGRDDHLIRKTVSSYFGCEYVETHTEIVVNKKIGDAAFKE